VSVNIIGIETSTAKQSSKNGMLALKKKDKLLHPDEQRFLTSPRAGSTSQVFLPGWAVTGVAKS